MTRLFDRFSPLFNVEGASGAPAGAGGEASPAGAQTINLREDDSFDFGPSDDYTGLEGGEDSVKTSPAQPVQTPTPAATPAPAASAPAVPAEQTQPQVPATPPTPAATPPQEAQPQAQQAAQPSGPDLSDPEQYLEQLTNPANRQALVQELAANEMFALTDAEKELLANDAEAAVPQLLARTYVSAIAGAVQQMQRFVPAMINKVLASQTIAKSNEQTFYSKFPSLSRDKHHETVAQVAKVYRSMNPKATPTEVMDAVGPMVHAMLKIPMANGATSAPSGTVIPVAPQQHFVPAAGGGRTGAIPSEVGEFDGLGMDFDAF